MADTDSIETSIDASLTAKSVSVDGVSISRAGLMEQVAAHKYFSKIAARQRRPFISTLDISGSV